jgi:hypothetical protein
MKSARELLALLGDLGKSGDSAFPAVVKHVDDDRTCTVVAADDTEFFDVRLQAITGATAGLYYKPAVGSVVLVERIGSSNEFAIILFSHLESIEMNVAGNQVTHDATGWELKKGTDTLGAVLGDLMDAIQMITCNVTAVGAPTGVPINAAVFAAIKTRMDVFIK